jgi:hypothetical protein
VGLVLGVLWVAEISVNNKGLQPLVLHWSLRRCRRAFDAAIARGESWPVKKM